MNLVLMLLLAFNSVQSSRISPKLDFGTSSNHGIISTSQQVSKINNDDIENIGVVCLSGQCGSTHKENDTNGIITDVHVHVVANIDQTKTHNEVVGDTPDIPVIVGYGGTTTSIPSSNIGFDVSTNTADSQRRIDDGFVQLDSPQFIFQSKSFDNENRPKIITNSLEVQVPYFEPTFHNHYFGEVPPPQMTWLNRRAGNFNPVEFKRISKPTWRPLEWLVHQPYNMHQVPQAGPLTCTCHPQGSTPHFGQPSRIDDKIGSLN